MASSPLSIFRRYQFAFLVGFSSLLMFSLLVGPQIQQYLQSRATQGSNPVVLKYSGGSVRLLEVTRLRKRHVSTHQVLDGMVREAQQRKGVPKSFALPRVGNDLDLLRLVVIASRAKQLGMRVSDAAINDYLRSLHDETLGNDDIARLLQRNDLPQQEFFEQLRTELLARNLNTLAASESVRFPGFSTYTPAAMFSGFNRAQRKVKAEILPVSVSDFVAQVQAEPTDTELKALFEEYKQFTPNPNSPDPGFALPYRASFEYVAADFDEFVEVAKKQITPDEIQAEYDRRVELGQYRRLMPSPQKPSPDDRPPAPPAAQPPPVIPSASDDEPKEPSKAENPAPESSDVAPAPSKSDAGGAERSADDDPPSKAKEDEASAGKEGGNDGENASNDDGFPLIPTSFPARPTSSLQADQDDPKTDDPKTDEPKSDDPKPDAPKADATETADPTSDEPKRADAPADDDKPVDPKADDPKPAPTEQDGSEPDRSATSGEPQGPQEPAAAEDQETIPLAEVRDQILDTLASAKAGQLLKEALDAAYSEVDAAFRRTLRAQLEPGGGAGETIDTETLAKKYGLVAGSTPMGDYFDYLETDIANVTEFDIERRALRPVFFERVFGPDTQVRKPFRIGGFGDKNYVVWKTDQTDAREATFEEARPQVVDAWKMVRARELADQEGLRLVKQVAEGKSIQESLGERGASAFVSDEFSWLSLGRGMLPTGGPGQYEVSEIEGVDRPGDDFMKLVFGLKVNEIGRAFNGPKNTLYIVRVLEENSEDARRQQFLRMGFSALQFSRDERLQSLRRWREGIEQEMQVEWQNAEVLQSY